MDTLIWLWNIAKVAIGLGFVVFVHELGHFLLAKWNGVKVEKFSIGFGQTIFGFKRGETEYVIAAIPLGGFVKMLGEGGEAGEGPPDPEAASDPRAFNNKSVGARMAIISAGVIMNLILGMLCYAYVFGQPREEDEARVGSTLAGSPAFEAGLRTGDQILAIDDSQDVTYRDLKMLVSLSTRGQVLNFRVKREGSEAPIDLPIRPRREADLGRPTIGVVAESSTKVIDYQPPGGTPNPPTLPFPADLRSTDLLVVVGAAPAGEPIAPIGSHAQFQRLAAKNRGKALDVAFQLRTRDDKPAEGTTGDLKATLPPNRAVGLGVRFGFEPISSIQKGSPAEAAGLKVGDRIVRIDGREDVDPMQFPLEVFDRAGSPMTIEVSRAGEGQAGPQAVSITVTPDDVAPSEVFLHVSPGEDLQVPGLGVAYPIVPVVKAVSPDSPAAKAGLKPGDRIDAVIIPPTKGGPSRGASASNDRWVVSREQTLKLDDKSNAWPYIYGTLQALPPQAVGLKIAGRAEQVSISTEASADAFTADRGLVFIAAYRMSPPLAFTDAIREGVNHTIENVSLMYATIRSLSTGQVGFNETAGPIGISRIAFAAAKSGLADFLDFLGFISINLAVLNFLPIPPLDGGQMVFLIAEKVRGKPLPDSAVIGGTYLGLLLVLFLMVFATYQDVARLLKDYFF